MRRPHGFRSEGTGAADRRGCRAAGTDLVVVGRRGLSGLTELVVGSVSQKMLHHADVLAVAKPVSQAGASANGPGMAQMGSIVVTR